MRPRVAVVVLACLILSAAAFYWKHRTPAAAPLVPALAPVETSRKPTGPIVARAPQPVEAAAPPKTNAFSRLRYLSEHSPESLTAEQLEPFLKANHRNAESLLAAYRTAHDKKYLLEALANFPNDPRVNFAAAVSDDIPPADRRAWLDHFKQADPNNALAGYLSALDYLKSGQTGLGMQEITSALSKPGWTDYSGDFIQNAKEAYLAAGYSPLDATVVSSESLILPQMAQLKQLGVNLGNYATSAQQGGDSTSAAAAWQAALNLGQQISGQTSGPLITTLVGMAVENIALNGMDPNAQIGDSGQTAQQLKDQLAQQRASIRGMTQQIDGIMDAMSEQDVQNYFERWQNFGEVSAIQWAVAKYGKQ